jgi:hypothetical protein
MHYLFTTVLEYESMTTNKKRKQETIITFRTLQLACVPIPFEQRQL